MRKTVVAGLVVGLSLLVAGPTAAEEASSFPAWYNSAPTPQYDATQPPNPMTVGNSADVVSSDQYKVSFLGLDGKGPVPGQADIEAEVDTSSTDTASIPLDQTPAVQTYGTVLEAFAPAAAKGTPLSVSAAAEGNTIVFHRPAAICGLPDYWRIDRVQVAMLTLSLQGEQQKVMLSVNLQFGDRPKPKCSTGEAAEKAEPSSGITATRTPTPMPTKGYVETQVDEAKQKVDDTNAKTKAKAQQIKTDLTKKVEHPDFSTFAGWFMAIAIIGGLAWIWYQRSRKMSTPPMRGPATRNHDGTKKSESRSSRPW
jgi:hypothetical protein